MDDAFCADNADVVQNHSAKQVKSYIQTVFSESSVLSVAYCF